jgi:hypothetical protein
MDLRRPLKAKNLKVIDYISRLYATFDGNSLWEIDKTSFEVLKMCDGKKTVDEIAEIISKKIDMKVEDVMPTLLDILKELENLKFIEYVSL